MLPVVTAVLLFLLSGSVPKGLWLLPRKDCGNTARADVSGRMKTAPKVVWSAGGSQPWESLRRVVVNGEPCLIGLRQGGVALLGKNGRTVWSRGAIGAGSVVQVLPGYHRKPAILVTAWSNGFRLLDAATGAILWTWRMSDEAYLGGYRVAPEGERTRLFVFPQNTPLGLCFEFSPSSPQPRLLWQRDYSGRYWVNYGPFLVLADMDNDGRPEIVLISKPGYAGVIDTDTGQVKFDLQYDVAGGDHIGRPYGLIRAGDLDGDGYRDVVVVSSQVEHYISVLHNEGGKALRLVWSRFVAMDFPTETVLLRPEVSSLCDVNGDGRPELVLGIWNETGDKLWHTVVLKPLDGFSARLADLPGRCFLGCRDVDGDGRPEILTCTGASFTFMEPVDLQAVDGTTLRDKVAVSGLIPVFAPSPLPSDTGFHAIRRSLLEVSQGILLRQGGQEVAWRIEGGRSVLRPLRLNSTARTVLLSEATGRIPGGLPQLKPSSAPSAAGPLVSIFAGKRELVFSRSDGTIVGGMPELGKPGMLRNSWTVRGANPSIWIGPKRERIVCAMDPEKDAVLLYRPKPGDSMPAPFRRIDLPAPLMRPSLSRTTGALIPFGARELRLYVPMRKGAHAVSGGVFDSQGHACWLDPANGSYPRIAAAGDLNGDGWDELFVDNHGRHLIYDDTGRSRLVAVGWGNEIPGRGDGAKYSVPILDTWGEPKAARVVLTPGLDALETLDGAGGRLAKVPYASTYALEWCSAALGQLRGPGARDVGMVDKRGTFYCADADTCLTRWSVDLGVENAQWAGVTAGDLDGDGRDEFLASLPTGDLIALHEEQGRGAILWRIRFDAPVADAIIADVEGDGVAEIIVELRDGRIQVAAGRNSAAPARPE